MKTFFSLAVTLALVCLSSHLWAQSVAVETLGNALNVAHQGNQLIIKTILELNIWNGKEASLFNYYEDDGSSYNCQQGQFYNRVIHFDPAKRTIVMDSVSGTFLSKYSTIKLVMHGFKNIQVIKVNGKAHTSKNNSRDIMLDNKRTALNITY